jgi:peptide/nickel transport system ATP-binding protein
MQRGRIEEAGSVSRVLGAPTSAYTRTLLAAVPRVELVPGELLAESMGS